MNINNQTVQLLLASLFVVASFVSLSAFNGQPFVLSDTSFSCNDLVNVSVNEFCEADIDPDEIVEGFEGDFSDFTLTIENALGETIPLPIPAEYVGTQLFAIATHIPSGLSCWGLVNIEDKWTPLITCANYNLLCSEDPDDFPPAASDNCGAPTMLLLGESVLENDICQGMTILRSYMAVDSSGNQSSTCNQIFTIQQIPLPDLPVDTSWSCEVFAAHANVVNPTKLTGNLNTTGSGIPDANGDTYCGYHTVYSDLVINGCGNTFSILRTWTVINWCTGEIILLDAEGDDNQQLIKVYDHTGPVVLLPPYSVNANVTGVNGCRSMDYLPPANIVDNCHLATQRILTPVGEAFYLNGQNGDNGGLIPSPGLPLGEHIIIYEVKDECGNITAHEVTVTVADMTAPVTVCDEFTSVSIGALGMAEVLAEVFDDGSYDYCCLDSFSVRRMATTCDSADLLFGKTATFCCEDVGDTVVVVFRAVDCVGNANDCMVSVLVEDKNPPVLISCPAAQTIDCSLYSDSLEIPISQGDYSVLEQYGQPEFLDNCEIVFLNISVNMNIDQCQQGTIVRSWQVTDLGGNGTLNCNQTISVEHTSDWIVSFPADVSLTCGQNIPDTGQPAIFFDNCELVAVSFEDEIFTVVPDACFKIVRNWVVINWCRVSDPIQQIITESSENQLVIDLDGDGERDDRTFQDGLKTTNYNPSAPLNGAQPDGYISYQQVIKVNDPTSPVVTCDPVTEICIFEDCSITFVLPLPDVMDCSPEVTISAIGDLGTGVGPFVDVPPGEYNMTYQVSDNCGNTGFCQTIVQVRDCKAPTPVCKYGTIVTIDEDEFKIIFPEILDDGSYDNCPGELNLSFSADITDTSLTLTCVNIGFNTVNIYVTDAAGNNAFCETFLFAFPNDDACNGNPLVAGSVTTGILEPVAGVEINLSGAMSQQATTFAEGNFEFEVETGGDYTLTPTKNGNPLNGVTTFDLVLLTKHVLGSEPLNSPLKLIAGDANMSNSVTTADILLLRKMILQITPDFPHGKSWRFVDKKHSFPDPQNPFDPALPEIINLNNVADDLLNADFFAVKLGDVNLSADSQD